MAAIDYKEFEERLQAMRKELRASINRLQEELNEIVAEDEINDMEDMASLQSESLHHTVLLKQQRQELLEVEHALEKIKEGTYGICEKSKHPIPVERLRAEPHTRFCIAHAKEAQR
jgi:DnaK suppressor protein